MHAGEGGKMLDVYLPPAKWYDWYTFQAVTDKGGVTLSIATPLDHLPVSVLMQMVTLIVCSYS